MKRYFFGVESPTRVGHFLFGPIEAPGVLEHHWSASHPSLQPGALDGRLTPRQDTRQGAARLHHIDGFTFLAWHDYSADGRAGCNSVFILEGSDHTTATMTREFAHWCPSIAARQPVVPFLAVGS